MTVLRRGRADDAGVLLTIKQAASVSALGDLFPPERYPYPEEAVLRDIRGILASGATALIAETDGRAVGFATTAPAWLQQLFVLPEFSGRGIGSQLHDEVVRLRREASDETLHLWTLEGNRGARRFYERRGWRLDGETRTISYPPQPREVRYSLDLLSRIEPC